MNGAALGDLLRVIPIAETRTQARTAVTLRSLETYAYDWIIHTRIVPLPISGIPRSPLIPR